MVYKIDINYWDLRHPIGSCLDLDPSAATDINCPLSILQLIRSPRHDLWGIRSRAVVGRALSARVNDFIKSSLQEHVMPQHGSSYLPSVAAAKCVSPETEPVVANNT